MNLINLNLWSVNKKACRYSIEFFLSPRVKRKDYELFEFENFAVTFGGENLHLKNNPSFLSMVLDKFLIMFDHKIGLNYEISFVKQTLQAMDDHWKRKLDKQPLKKQKFVCKFLDLWNQPQNRSKFQLKILLGCQIIREELTNSSYFSDWADYIANRVSWNPFEEKGKFLKNRENLLYQI